MDLLLWEIGKTVEICIKGVLWVPGLPCRLLTTGAIRWHGGKHVDSGYRRSLITLRRGGPRIELEKRNGFTTLRGEIERKDKEGMVHAALAGKKQQLSLKV